MLTKEQRQQIAEDFAKRHDGQFDPALFVREVKRRGENHPAYVWFNGFDTEHAASEYWLWRARVFAHGLTIKFKIEEVGRGGSIKVIEQEMPLMLSPTAGRQEGGGYVLSDPNDPSHLAMLAGEGATALRSWLRRYGAAVRVTGTPERIITHLAEALERAAGIDEAEAAE